MYSPKIDEKLIPVIYHTAKAQGVPMTTLVNHLLIRALAQESLPPAARDALTQYVVFAMEDHRQKQTIRPLPRQNHSLSEMETRATGRQRTRDTAVAASE